MHPQGPNLNVNFKMDNYQVSALRHKRHIVACNVQLDQETIAELTSRKLINKAMLENVKVVDVQSMCRPTHFVAIFAIFHKVVNSMF